MSASKWRGFAATLILVGATAGCSYNSDLFDFVSWENSDLETEPVALSNSQLEALRAKREAQLAELDDPSYQSVELGMPDLNRLTAGHIDAAKRGAAALISDSAALLAAAGPVDSTLDALLAEELAAIEDERAALAPPPPAEEEDSVFIIGTPIPQPAPPPAPVETAGLDRDPAAERRAAVRREEQNVVRRNLNFDDELAQRLQSPSQTSAEIASVATPDPGAAEAAAIAAAAITNESAEPRPSAPAPATLLPTPAAEPIAPLAPPASEPSIAPSETAQPEPPQPEPPQPAPAATAQSDAAQSDAAELADRLAAALDTTDSSPPAAAAPSGPAPEAPPPPETTAEEAPEPAAPTAPSEPKVRGVLHVVQSDDTLAGIARQYNSSPSAIRRANEIDPNRGLFVGEEIFVPQGLGRRGAAAPPPSLSEPKPQAIPAVRRLASPNLDQYRTDRAPTVTPPVEGGRIILNYGDPDGEQLSTGVDIAAPVGTPVTAASDGRVAYLRKLGGRDGGSLVLVHADGMITRYSRLQNIVLRHGSSVRRGQKIGEIGRPEGGREARLKFELLDGQDPVDPTQFFRASLR